MESEKGIFSRGGKEGGESARNAEDTPQPKLRQKKTQLFPFIFMPQLLLLLLLRDYSMYIYRKYYFSPIPLRAAAGVPFSRIFLKWSKIRVKGYLRVVERERERAECERGGADFYEMICRTEQNRGGQKSLVAVFCGWQNRITRTDKWWS